MRYVGGKVHLSKYIAPILQTAMKYASAYIEPFVGGAAVAERLVQNGSDILMILGDLSLDLILMYQDVQAGIFVPPTYISREQYDELKMSEPSALRGFVGYGASWGGVFFSGHAMSAQTRGRDVTRSSSVAVINTVERLKDAHFFHCDYRQLIFPDKALIYCDPPYRGTMGYLSKDFDNDAFWQIATGWAKNNIVFVSELQAPDDWIAIFSKQRHSNITRQRGRYRATIKIERLYVHESQLHGKK